MHNGMMGPKLDFTVRDQKPENMKYHFLMD